MASIARSSAALSSSAACRSVVRPSLALPAVRSTARVPARKFSAPSPSTSSSIVPRAVPVEVIQLAGEAGFIFSTGLTMCAITLTGLAIGFVLLRVEALVEEGKI